MYIVRAKEGGITVKIKSKTTAEIGYGNRIDTHAMSEAIAYSPAGDCSSEFIKAWRVWLERVKKTGGIDD